MLAVSSGLVSASLVQVDALSNYKVIFEVLVALVERGQVFFTKFFEHVQF